MDKLKLDELVDNKMWEPGLADYIIDYLRIPPLADDKFQPNIVEVDQLRYLATSEKMTSDGSPYFMSEPNMLYYLNAQAEVESWNIQPLVGNCYISAFYVDSGILYYAQRDEKNENRSIINYVNLTDAKDSGIISHEDCKVIRMRKVNNSLFVILENADEYNYLRYSLVNNVVKRKTDFFSINDDTFCYLGHSSAFFLDDFGDTKEYHINGYIEYHYLEEIIKSKNIDFMLGRYAIIHGEIVPGYYIITDIEIPLFYITDLKNVVNAFDLYRQIAHDPGTYIHNIISRDNAILLTYSTEYDDHAIIITTK